MHPDDEATFAMYPGPGFNLGGIRGLLSRHLGFDVRNERRVRRAALDHGRSTGPAGDVRRPVPPEATPGLTDDERRILAEIMPRAPSPASTWPPQTWDGTFEPVQAGDAEVVQEPTEPPSGIRDCAVRNPAGRLIRIQELR